VNGKQAADMVWRDAPRGGEELLDPEAEQERLLAAQARAGADWALAALIARYQPAVTRYLTRLIGDPNNARELAEQVFQRMESRLHGPHGAEYLRLWLLRACTESGLETLRHPRRGRPPLLGTSSVAGLLTSETTANAQAAIRDGVSRIRDAMGAVARQARPLIWQSDSQSQEPSRQSPTQPSRDLPPASTKRQPRPTPLIEPDGETLDAIDPHEEFRHKLVRLTLADLSYGDAQCLALHLVAGLNQAEVARALGLTNSAARKRIVQGLSQFSARYQEAVRSLGLPDEIVYGDTLTKRAPEPAPIMTPPEPAPVIVAETPEEADDIVALDEAVLAQGAADQYNQFADEGATVGAVGGGTMYYRRTTGDLPEFPAAGHELFAPANAPESAPLYSDYPAYNDLAGRETDAYGAPYPAPPGSIPFEADDANAAADSAPFSEQSGVTRIAADAIVGPVVDALPVRSEPLDAEFMYAEPNGPSEALAYELHSSENEALSANLSWIDSSGMLEPLSFEAVVSAQESDSTSDLSDPDDDPWARSVYLEFDSEELAQGVDATDSAATMASLIGDDGSAPRELSIALDEGDYGWERSRQTPSQPEVVMSYTSIEPNPSPPAANATDAELANDDDLANARRAPVARSLEELWDEAADL
jgi:DNA-directed RNA polymerase specialized sigma24 family protein